MDVAHEIALMVCQKCDKLDHESEVNFSKRLYQTYNACNEFVNELIEQDKNKKAVSQQIDMDNLL